MTAAFDFTVAPLEHDYVFRGCSCVTTDARVFDDAATLAREFARGKESIEKRVMPVVTCVTTGLAGEDGAYTYYMGDQVEKKGGNKDFELYHYRRRRFRRALKLVMELAFPVHRAG